MAIAKYIRVAHLLLRLSAGDPEGEEFRIGPACVPNISAREQRTRLIGGVIQLAISLIVLVILVARGINRWWRLPLFLLFWGAGAGFFQWRDKT